MTPKPWSNTPLNLEEFYEAIEEGKRKKYFHLKHRDYWESQESKKGKTSTTENKTT
jgi:hypothetical protein